MKQHFQTRMSQIVQHIKANYNTILIMLNSTLKSYQEKKNQNICTSCMLHPHLNMNTET